MSEAWERVHQETEEVRARLSRGHADPDGFFADRGFVLSCYEAEGEWWCDLGKVGREHAAPRYGRGVSQIAC
jgi:hypothetical protein